MDQRLISINDARDAVLSLTTQQLGTDEVLIADALDRTLAAEVRTAGDVPPFACSAMDGYAVLHGHAGRMLRVTGESRAGTPNLEPMREDEAIRISTGGAVPPAATAVVRQEDVSVRDGHILTLVDVHPGTNIREAGSDMRAHESVLAVGTVIGPHAIAVAVAAGAARLRVARRPHVAVLCTGDELRAPGHLLQHGEIHNTNGPMLVALATRCGAIAGPQVHAPDDLEATVRACADGLDADMLIISGGVSVGPHDHVRSALDRLGVEERFWGVALQPGKPTWFGTSSGTPVFGLPGNPLSAAVMFTLLVAPALRALQGAPGGGRRGDPHGSGASGEEHGDHRAQAALAEPVRRNPERERAILVRLMLGARHTLAVPTGVQESHRLSALLGADALAIIPRGRGDAPAGEQVALEQLLR